MSSSLLGLLTKRRISSQHSTLHGPSDVSLISDSEAVVDASTTLTTSPLLYNSSATASDVATSITSCFRSSNRDFGDASVPGSSLRSSHVRRGYINATKPVATLPRSDDDVRSSRCACASLSCCCCCYGSGFGTRLRNRVRRCVAWVCPRRVNVTVGRCGLTHIIGLLTSPRNSTADTISNSSSTCCSSRRVRPVFLALAVLLTFLLCVALLPFVVSLVARPTVHAYDVPPPFALPENRDALSVLVMHSLDGAVSAPNATLTGGGGRRGVPEMVEDTHVKLLELPSWTLRVVEATCASCLDTYTYAPALKAAAAAAAAKGNLTDAHLTQDGVQRFLQNVARRAASGETTKGDKAVHNEKRQQLQRGTETALAATPPHGVFATSAAALGQIGPMLLAMLSVTDDLQVARELPLWDWVGESFSRQRAVSSRQTNTLRTNITTSRQALHTDALSKKDAAPRHGSRRLAVMGIPSTDQPSRRALRDAQRATWFTYADVGRAANHFRGAVLPLYIFAASEEAPPDVLNTPQTTPHTNDVVAEKVGVVKSDGGAAAVAAVAAGGAAAVAGTAVADSVVEQVRGPSMEAEAHLVSALLPTTSEFHRAARLQAIRDDGRHDVTTNFYARRVYRLRDDFTERLKTLERKRTAAGAVFAASAERKQGEARDTVRITDADQKVCAAVVERVVQLPPLASSDPAAFLLPGASSMTEAARNLSLPVVPNFVAPARFICHASADLWLEALTHRNVVWLDMMTDRKPTTNKTLGDTGDWGLPAEVGMTQKTMLWLYYAYHAFPDVPYIMKGDDDTYVKVPQFLSDLNVLRTGHREAALEAKASPPFHTSPTRSFLINLRGLDKTPSPAPLEATHMNNTLRSAERTQDMEEEDDEECLYWGATRVFMDSIAFNPGPAYALQRRLVQTALETLPGRDPSRDLLRLASEKFNAARTPWYTFNALQNEDASIGKVLKDRTQRSQQLCPRQRWWTMREISARSHDVHRGKQEVVSWATVVVHRCTPADYVYLHHYFATEYLVAQALEAAAWKEEKRRASLSESTRRCIVRKAEAEAGRWVRDNVVHKVTGWQSLPAVSYTYNAATDPAFVLSPEDGVAVYDIPYEPWDEARTSVVTGGTSRLRMVKGFFASLFL